MNGDFGQAVGEYFAGRLVLLVGGIGLLFGILGCCSGVVFSLIVGAR